MFVKKTEIDSLKKEAASEDLLKVPMIQHIQTNNYG